MNYWLEALESSLDEHGIFNALTKEQREAVAKDLELSHEMHGEAMGYSNIPNPLESENKRLVSEVKRERDKVICRECNGTGENIGHGPCHSSVSQCWKCSGVGRHDR